jgi:hypothetical protein
MISVGGLGACPNTWPEMANKHGKHRRGIAYAPDLDRKRDDRGY